MFLFKGAGNARRPKRAHSKSWDASSSGGKISPVHASHPGAANGNGRRTVSYPSKDREAFRQALVNIIMYASNFFIFY